MRSVTVARFWAKVEKTEACWNWKGHVDSNGYGRFHHSYAHRYSLLINRPALIGIQQVDHRCHNKACVNPDHLRAVTNKQNQENRRGANKNSKSGVRGVNWMPHYGKWRAQFKHNGRSIYVGIYETIEEAEAAVVAKRRQVFKHSERDRATAKRPSAKVTAIPEE